MLAFPRRTAHVLLPSRPFRAARAGLGLYSSTFARQRLVARAAPHLLRLGLGRWMRVSLLPARVDVDWWRTWLRDVAEPCVGKVAHVAFRMGTSNVSALLMDDAGRPLGFVKVVPARDSGPLSQYHAALQVLSGAQPTTFRVPGVLAYGRVDGHTYLLLAPLPEGAHKMAPPHPDTIGAIVDEIQVCLAGLPRPLASPPHYRPWHGDFTVHNLRRASDGRLWLFDWEDSGWAPKLADESWYWVTWYRVKPLVGRATPRYAARILSLLRRRGSDDEILTAIGWRKFDDAGVQALRDAVTRLIRS